MSLRRDLAVRTSITAELLLFFWRRRWWWMTPMLLFLLLLAGLLIFAQTSPLAPFTYTLF